MTVSSAVNRNDYAGNGSTTSFAVSFRFLENSHIKATLRDALSTETLQVETTDYTLTGAGGAGGGTLVMIVAPPTGTTLTIQRDVPATQETDYVENDEFPAESHEDALDKLTMLVQQQGEDSTRHIGFSDTVSDATGAAVELSQDATQRADKFLGFDSAGNIVTKTASVAGLVDQDSQDKRYGPTFATVAAMTAANPVSIDGVVVTFVAGMSVSTQGYTTAGDGGGATYLIVPSQAADGFGDHVLANGNVAVLQSVNGVRNVKQYGATGDGVTIDRVPFRECIDAGEGTVLVPEGTYLMDLAAYPGISASGVSSIVIKDGVDLVGTSRTKSIIKLKAAAFGAGAFGRIIASLGTSGSEPGLSDSSIRNLTVDGNLANQNDPGTWQVSNILLEALSNVVVDQVDTINASGNGVMVRGQVSAQASSVRITNIRAVNGKLIGVQASQFSGLIITGIYADNWVNNGIDIFGEQGIGIAASAGFIIDDYTITNCLTGVFPETVAHGVIGDGYIEGCTAGIHFNRINSEPLNLRVTGAVISNCTQGFLITGDSGGITLGGSVDGCTTAVQIGAAGGNVSNVVATGIRATNCTNFFLVEAVNAAFIEVYLNTYEGLSGAHITKTITGTETNVNIDYPVNLSGKDSALDYRNLESFSAANKAERSFWAFDTSSQLTEYAKREFQSPVPTAGVMEGRITDSIQVAGTLTEALKIIAPSADSQTTLQVLDRQGGVHTLKRVRTGGINTGPGGVGRALYIDN